MQTLNACINIQEQYPSVIQMTESAYQILVCRFIVCLLVHSMYCIRWSTFTIYNMHIFNLSPKSCIVSYMSIGDGLQ